MLFTPFDPARWPRREVFHYFSTLAPTGYSLTVRLDVTSLRRTLRAHGLRFYPAYLWAVTRCLSAHPEFTTAVRDGQVGFYDSLTPLYAVFHPDDHTFSLMWTEFDTGFSTFHARFVDNERHHAATDGWHVRLFLDELQALMDGFDAMLP